MNWHELFLAEFEIIKAYDCGQYSYEDAYRHCFKVANLIMGMAW